MVKTKAEKGDKEEVERGRIIRNIFKSTFNEERQQPLITTFNIVTYFFVLTLKVEVNQCETRIYIRNTIISSKQQDSLKKREPQSMFENLIWNGICRWAVEPCLWIFEEKMTRDCMQSKVWFETSFDCESHSVSFQTIVTHLSYNLRAFLIDISFHFIHIFQLLCPAHSTHFTSTKKQFKHLK